MSTCLVDGCDKAAAARGVCATHYMQLRRAKSIPIGTRARGSLEDRFWRHVEKTADCWLWSGHTKAGSAYGRIGGGGKDGKYLLAHRVSYEIHKGVIPDDMVVMHQCDNPRCVNPAHLSLGTTAENIKDAYDKGRKSSPFGPGEAHVGAVLTEDRVREIRSSPLSNAQLARAIGCSKNAVSCVRLGKTWKHVT